MRMMTSLELDQALIFEWPRVMRGVMADAEASDFMKSFAKSIARHRKRAAWTPSEKQQRLMRDLLEKYGFNPEPDFDLVERD